MAISVIEPCGVADGSGIGVRRIHTESEPEAIISTAAIIPTATVIAAASVISSACAALVSAIRAAPAAEVSRCGIGMSAAISSTSPAESVSALMTGRISC